MSYESINFKPPKGVREELARGLQWHREGHSGDGLRPATVSWATRLERGEDISPDKARKMRAWLARHESDKRGEGFSPGEDGFPSAGRVAWALWGGDPAVGWSNKLVKQMETEDAQTALKQATPQPLPLEGGGPKTRAYDSVGRILAEGSAKLPKLSEDGQRNWIFVTSSPGFFYYGEEIEINEGWIDGAIKTYEKMKRRGYEAPVLAEHNSAVTEGLRLGDVVRLVKAKVDGRWALVAEVRWALSDAHEKIESGQIRYFSPAIAAIEDDETGEILEPVISELSVVAAPHQKGATTHVLAKEAAMAEAEAVVDSKTTVEKRIDKLASEVESIAGTVKALADLADSIKAMTEPRLAEDSEEEETEEEIEVEVEVEEEEEEDKKEMAEVKSLRNRLGQLELQRDQAVYSADLPLGSSIELTQSVADMLFGIWRKDREAFSKVIGGAITKPEQATVPQVSSPWAKMLGEAPVATEPTRMNDEELHKSCLSECGGDAAKASKLYYQRKYGV